MLSAFDERQAKAYVNIQLGSTQWQICSATVILHDRLLLGGPGSVVDSGHD